MSHFYYRPHLKDGEGNSFTLFVSSHSGEGGSTYPGQVQTAGVPTLAGGGGYLPLLGPDREGTYPSWEGVPTLARFRRGVPTLVGRVYLPWPGPDGGYLP